MDKTTTQRRDKANGQYAHSTNDALCACGHRLGVHAADCRDGERPCFVNDFEDAEPCECMRFRKVRAKRSK